ncbi:MAG: hypothetical protein KJZ85_09640 [Rhodobacteraceae bacterium]|jgi:hypothetical protein|nr:hypothetical protein [Paracoccaceae bacterium]
MPREIVFHLGDRKTGSTAIQHALRTQGWEGEVPALAFPARLHHAGLANAFLPGAPPKKAEAQMRALAEQIDGLDAGVVVVSSENFESSDPVTLAAAVDRVLAPRAGRIRLIAYVRPHIERVVSSWAERIKLGLFHRPLDAYIERTGQNGRFLYHDRLQRWRTAFGTAFTVRPMIRAELLDNDVVNDFLAFAFDGRDFRLTAPVLANESLSLRHLALLAAVHRAFAREQAAPSPKLRAAVGRNLALRLASVPSGDSPRPAVSGARIPGLQDYYRADAAAVDAAFFQGAPLTRALQGAAARAVDGEQSIRLADHFPGPEGRHLQVLAEFVAELSCVAPNRLRPHFVARRLAAGLPAEEDDAEAGDHVAEEGTAVAARRRGQRR